MKLTNELIEKFNQNWIPEPNSGCWIWIGTSEKRYGKFFINPKSQKAHRVSYTIYCGEIPKDHVVRHRCDTTFCVNPGHLETGSQYDNVHDMIKRGRMYKRHGIKNLI